MSEGAQSGGEIAIRGIPKHWCEVRALDGIDITVPAGSFTALLGPSGCGKSTLLRIVAGLEAPTAGRISIAGQDVTERPADKRNLSMVLQNYALFQHLTVAENITFGLRTRGAAKAAPAERLAQVAQLLGLSDHLARKPGQLSGGQQQRVALGRAVISRRPVCLMDEPLSNLDAKLRHAMRDELRALPRRLGFTFPGRDLLFTLVLLQLLAMPDILIVENYKIIHSLRAVDTLQAIALPYIASGSGVFLIRQAFMTVPCELDDAARIEGAEPLAILWRVYVPLAKPTYLAYGLVSVSHHWNNFLWPLIVTNSVTTRPVTVGLSDFATTDSGTDWSVISAATLMTTAPLLVAFLLFQRQFVQGFLRAGIK